MIIKIGKNNNIDGRRKYYGYIKGSGSLYIHRNGKIRKSTSKCSSISKNNNKNKCKDNRYFTGHFPTRKSVINICNKLGLKYE